MHVKFDESDSLSQEQVQEDEEIGLLRHGESGPQKMETIARDVLRNESQKLFLRMKLVK